MAVALSVGSFLEAAALVVSGDRGCVSSFDSIPDEYLFCSSARHVFGFCGLVQCRKTSVEETNIV